MTDDFWDKMGCARDPNHESPLRSNRWVARNVALKCVLTWLKGDCFLVAGFNLIWKRVSCHHHLKKSQIKFNNVQNKAVLLLFFWGGHTLKPQTLSRLMHHVTASKSCKIQGTRLWQLPHRCSGCEECTWTTDKATRKIVDSSLAKLCPTCQVRVSWF